MKRAVYGTFVHTPTPAAFVSEENVYAIVEDGRVCGWSATCPPDIATENIVDWDGHLIVPAFTDLHFHAVQYANCGRGYDKTLLDWLTTYTFPEEARFADIAYAERIFARVLYDLWHGGSLHSVAFATVYPSSAKRLMAMYDRAGLKAYVGKVHIDRHGGVITESYDDSVAGLREMAATVYTRVKPIVTPRFTPAVSDRLMKTLGEMAAAYDLPVQSHLNETKAEIAWVHELVPEATSYFDTYERAGLIRPGQTILAHAIHNTPGEVEALHRHRVFVAHCPSSNANLGSGVAPVKALLDAGVALGLGSDISGGETLFMPRVIVDAVKASKTRAALLDEPDAVIDEAIAFHMATRGGGAFFGACGAFEPGFAFDALVIDDGQTQEATSLSPNERLRRWLYRGRPDDIVARYLDGVEVAAPSWS